ncbi:MAG TPA: enoyl-CoA hydratase/isomerase family protein [Dehalococcoidia bacterium]|jgi:enoyl-CoA hydratase/carnithine racemase
MTAVSNVIECPVDQNGVGWLWMNRPDRLNALNFDLITQASEQLKTWERDPNVRCIVISGRGRAFCAGDDVKGMSDGSPEWDTMEYTLRREAGWERLFKTIYDLRKPVIAAINGNALGAGAFIALAADIRIMKEDAPFGFVFVKIGITGGNALVTRYVGLTRASEMVLTGETVNGTEAERIGLVNRAVPAEAFDAEVEAWARKLAAGPTRVLGIAKHTLHRGLYSDNETAFAINALSSKLSQETKDSTEGKLALRERRPAAFTGQ